MKNFSIRLKELRGDMSQESAARKVGMSQQVWARYENKGCLPGAAAILQICCRYNVSADWLLGLSDSRDAAPLSSDLLNRISKLEEENAKLKSDVIRLEGENIGLNKALQLLMAK